MLTEYFVVTNSFAAPFVSEQDTRFVSAERHVVQNPKEGRVVEAAQ